MRKSRCWPCRSRLRSRLDWIAAEAAIARAQHEYEDPAEPLAIPTPVRPTARTRKRRRCSNWRVGLIRAIERVGCSRSSCMAMSKVLKMCAEAWSTGCASCTLFPQAFRPNAIAISAIGSPMRRAMRRWTKTRRSGGGAQCRADLARSSAGAPVGAHSQRWQRPRFAAGEIVSFAAPAAGSSMLRRRGCG